MYIYIMYKYNVLHVCMTQSSRTIFAIGGVLCIINNLGGLVNNRCGKLSLHVRELLVAMQRSKAKQKLFKGQPLS